MIKKFFIILMALAILAACQLAPALPTATATSTRLPMLQTVIPTNLPYQTPIPIPTSTKGIYPTYEPYPTLIPYPTASVVQANTVAFITMDDQGSPHTYSLSTANIDGSGERKLAEVTRLGSSINVLLQWAPDGQWISYRSGDEFWIVSPRSLAKKKLLSFPENSRAELFRYAWSPDGSKIAYKDVVSHDEAVVTPTPDPESGTTPVVVGIIDLKTGKTSEIFSYLPFDETIFSWTPNGNDLLLSNRDSFFLFDVNTMAFVKEITVDTDNGNQCTPSWYDQIFWSLSPNAQWFAYSQHGNGPYYNRWLCIASLDGKANYSINKKDVKGIYGIPSAWDKTGDSLYLVVRNYDHPQDPRIDPDVRLVRFNVKTREVKRLLSLEDPEPNGLFWEISISPNGCMLALYSYKDIGMATPTITNLWHASENTFMIMDLQSLAIKKFTVDFDAASVEMPFQAPAWAADNKNIIFFVKQPYEVRFSNSTIGSYNYGHFYALDITTGKTTIFSGIHPAENEQVSPVATFP